MALKKNIAYNLVGILVPTLLAVVATPWIIKGMGVEQFGMLTLIWIFLGYFSFLDFGISRSLTNLVAVAQATQSKAAATHVKTASLLMLMVFLPVALLAFPFSEALFDAIFKQTTLSVAVGGRALGWVLLCLPVVVLTAVYKGALEGVGRFDVTNKIRLPMALWSYAGPLAVLPFTKQIDHVVLFLVVGRLITLMAFVWCVQREASLRGGRFSKASLRELVTLGGWLGAGSLMSPLMIYIDRMVLAGAVSLKSVAYYTTPMDVMAKMLQPADAVAGVFFASMSQTAATSPVRFAREQRLFAGVLVALLAPAASFIAIFSHELLALWLGADFASKAALITAILAAGTFMNGVARAPYVSLQVSGKARLTALTQLVQFPLYVPLLWWASQYGLVGIACAWLVRVSLDSLFYFVALAHRHVLVTLGIGVVAVAVAGATGVLFTGAGWWAKLSVAVPAFAVFVLLMAFHFRGDIKGQSLRRLLPTRSPR